MSLTRMLAMLAMVIVVFGGPHLYLGARLIALQILPRGVAFPVVAALALSSVAAMALARTGTSFLPARALIWVGYVWMGTFLLLLVAALAGHLLSGLAILGQKLSPTFPSGLALWGGRSFLGLACLAAVWALTQALRTPEVHEVEVRIPSLPKAFEGYRIAHITDTHLSSLLGRDWCERMVERVNAAQPDLVVHTGDLADGSVEALRSSVEPLSRLKSPKLFVTGNHEAYSGLTPWGLEVLRLGFLPLTNAHASFSRDGENLVVGGITDYNQKHFVPHEASDVRQAFQGAPEGTRILLAHQPRSAFQAQGQGISLQLSGHTHGGQIWPFHYLVRLQQPMNAGFAKLGDVLVFTSRGAGFWGPPLRLFAPPEVPILVLRRG